MIRITFVLFLACLLVADIDPGPTCKPSLQVAPVLPAPNVTRRALVPGDPSRDWFVAFRFAGGFRQLTGTLTTGTTTVPLLPRIVAPSADWDAAYWQSWAVPSTCPPGTYALTVGGEPCGAVTVQRPGTLVVPLPAGVVRLREPIRLTANTTLDVRGTTFVSDGPDYAVAPADGATVKGGTFVGFRHLLGRQNARDLVLDGLTVRGGSLRPGGELYQLHLLDCRFERCSTSMLGFSVCQRCQWIGLPDSPATTVWGPEAVFLDCEWVGTDRGISFQSVQEINDCLCVGLSFQTIRRAENAAELLNFEGRFIIQRTRIHHIDATGCAGCLVTGWSAPIDGLAIQDASCERNPIFLAGGFDGCDVDQRNVSIRWLESAGVVECGPRTDLTISDSAFLSLACGRHNNRWVNLAWYGPRPALRTQGKGALRNVSITGLPAGWTQSEGFAK